MQADDRGNPTKSALPGIRITTHQIAYLMHHAVTIRAQGDDVAVIVKQLLLLNAEDCTPPLPRSMVKQLARFVAGPWLKDDTAARPEIIAELDQPEEPTPMWEACPVCDEAGCFECDHFGSMPPKRRDRLVTAIQDAWNVFVLFRHHLLEEQGATVTGISALFDVAEVARQYLRIWEPDGTMLPDFDAVEQAELRRAITTVAEACALDPEAVGLLVQELDPEGCLTTLLGDLDPETGGEAISLDFFRVATIDPDACQGGRNRRVLASQAWSVERPDALRRSSRGCRQ